MRHVTADRTGEEPVMMVIDDVEKIQSFLIEPEIIAESRSQVWPDGDLFFRRDGQTLWSRLTLRDMAELVCGRRYCQDQRFFEAPGAAGVTTGQPDCKGNSECRYGGWTCRDSGFIRYRLYL